MTDVTDEFLASPIIFLQKYPCSCSSEFNGLLRLNVQVMLDDVGAARLMRTPVGQAGTLFYILGWMRQQASVGTLGDAARFFFTGPLSGCTFAVDKNWYRPKVIHVNQTMPVGGMNVHGMLATVGHHMAASTSWLKPWKTGPNITVVQSHNRHPDHIYNILGYRTGSGWNFYQQVVHVRGLGDMVVQDLRELDTWF